MKVYIKSIFIVTFLIVFILSCSMEKKWDGYYYVKYRMESSEIPVNITVLNKDGNIVYYDAVEALPWEHEITIYCGTDDYDYAIVSVGASGDSLDAILTCTIYVKKFEEDSYDIVETLTSNATCYISAVLTPEGVE